MKTPKPPIGFVPVDSEEARGIAPTQWVNQVFIAKDKWLYSYGLMNSAREASKNMHYHVQLPPPVEWEEVWGIDFQGEPFNSWLTKNKERFIWIGKLPEDKQQAIVRALNDMEGRDG